MSPPASSVKLAGAAIASVQAALALTLALPPEAEAWDSGSTLPKLTVGVSRVSCTDARLVNLTVWFCESVVGGAAKAETADSEAAATTTPHAIAMRMRDMHSSWGIEVDDVSGLSTPKKAREASSE